MKGGVGAVIEYSGEGVKTLSVPQRATITNMGAELGATSSIFPSDDVTHAFLKAQGREGDFIEISPDPDATYDAEYTVDVAYSTNRELFASDNKHIIDNLVKNTDSIRNEQLKSMMNRILPKITEYCKGEYILTDDKAPVELLGMQVIDEMISKL